MAEEKPFRVLLDLSELNLNIFKYVWMNVPPRELKTIADFKYSVLKKLGFDRKDIKLFVHDGVLLEDEKIIVLRENDTVKVQFETNTDSPRHNSSIYEMYRGKAFDARCSGECNNDTNETMQHISKKRKRKSEIQLDDAAEEDCSQHNTNKKKRRSKSRNISTSEETAAAANSNEEIVQMESTLKEAEQGNVSAEFHVFQDIGYGDCEEKNTEKETFVTENNISKSYNEFERFEPPFQATVVSPVLQGNNCKKKKRRKRHKKRDTLASANTSQPSNDADASPFPEMESTRSNFYVDDDNYVNIRKHIRFTSPPPQLDVANRAAINTDSYVVKSKLGSSVKSTPYTKKIPQCSTTSLEENLDVGIDSASKSKSIETDSSTKETPYYSTNKTVISRKKSSTPAVNFSTQDSWTVSDMLSSSTEGLGMHSVNKSETHENKSPASGYYSEYPILKCLPSVGSHIAYKILELDNSYSPVVSGHKEGIITEINLDTDELQIELINEEVKSGRVGKFENLREDEIPPDEVIKNVSVNWHSLIQPCLISTG